MLILALDVAKSTGIAVGPSAGKPTLSTTSFGRWDGAMLHEAYAACTRWTAGFLGETKPDLVVIEAPLPGNTARGGADGHAIALAFGLQAIIRGEAEVRGIRCEMVAIQTWRKFFIGAGNLRSAQAKAATIETCRRAGWAPANNDEADAAGIWAYAAARYAREPMTELLPLLRRGHR